MSAQLPAVCWMFCLDTSLFVGPVTVVKSSKKTAVISSEHGRVTGYRRCVPIEELHATREAAISAAWVAVNERALKLRQEATRLEAQMSAASHSQGFFDGWSHR